MAIPTPSACPANLWNVFLFLSMIYRCGRKRKSSLRRLIDESPAEIAFPAWTYFGSLVPTSIM